jgi:hypothetical protein
MIVLKNLGNDCGQLTILEEAVFQESEQSVITANISRNSSSDPDFFV